jgi:hypothetical protein
MLPLKGSSIMRRMNHYLELHPVVILCLTAVARLDAEPGQVAPAGNSHEPGVVSFDLPVKGKRIVLLATRTKKLAGDTRPGNGTSARILVEIIAEEGSKKVIRWTFQDVKLIGPGPFSPMDQALLKLVDGAVLEFDVDAHSGKAGTLRNREQAIAMVNRVVDALVEHLSKSAPSGASSEQVAAFREMMKARLSQQDVLDQSLLKDAHAYLMPYSFLLPTDKPLEYEEEIAALGGSVPARTRVVLDDYDRASPTVRVSFVRTANPGAVDQAASRIVQSLAKDSGVPSSQKAPASRKAASSQAMKGIRLEDKATFTINRTSGWVTHGRFQRIGAQGGRRIVEAWEFKPAPSAE